MIVPRTSLFSFINETLNSTPVTVILGPRQCGKTTISRLIAENRNLKVFDLEDPADVAALTSSPMVTLESLEGLVIIDEIQRMPGY